MSTPRLLLGMLVRPREDAALVYPDVPWHRTSVGKIVEVYGLNESAWPPFGPPALRYEPGTVELYAVHFLHHDQSPSLTYQVSDREIEPVD